MKYPVVVDKQKRKEYVGHSSHVTRVRFTFDDSFLISVGGLDKSLIIWKTDFGAEPAADLTKECAEEGADDVDVPQEKTKKHVEPPPEEAKDPDDIFDKEKFDKGDQFMAVKPWMGAIKEPSPPFYDDKKNGHKPPKCALEIEYVYGYRTKDMRNNLYYLASGKVLYNAAALGIVLDLETNTQTFFDKHEDDITAIDLSPDRTTVATGELGAKPNLFVWNADTKEVKCSFKGKLTKGVIALAFSPSGKRLVGGAIDVDHYLAVFDVSGAGSVVWTDKGGPDTIIDLRFTTDDSFTTIGVKHYYCWTLNNGTIKKDRG
jgi:microtubule-associated protein-like 6